MRAARSIRRPSGKPTPIGRFMPSWCERSRRPALTRASRTAPSGSRMRPALQPVSPDIRLNALLALMFSALIAVGGAVIADLLDKTVKDPEQVLQTLHIEVVGSLPLVKNVPEGRVLALPASSAEDRRAE